MKIIIIGEYSSFSKNLSEGFRTLGHECFVFSWGDGFKKIEQDGEYSYTIDVAFNNGGNIELFKYILYSFYSYYKLN